MICRIFALRKVVMAGIVRGLSLFSNTIKPKNVNPVSTSCLWKSVSDWAT